MGQRIVSAKFTIACRLCGAGRHITLQSEAEREGWEHVQFTPENQTANYVGLCPSCRIPKDVPFSLTCAYCDAGMDVETFESAMAQGWCNIDYVPELSMANFLGVCPECREED